MKRYKSFILFGALALSFAACSTDDLEQNIDTLTSRVESVEAQVQALNNNMNVIRVLLDGNKTIQTATEDQATGTWTLLLSNGETLTLTPGNTDNTTYPVIEISEDGYWVIEGVKSDRRAEAEDGQAATITPQFQIVDEGTDNKVWQVSYDEGATWVYVTDETGAHVSATGSGTGTNPIKEASSDGSYFKIKLSDDSEHTIPIIAGLVCQITDPEGMENGKWYVSGTQTFTVTVSEDEDIVARVVAPAEWKASMTNDGAERTVSVTAPFTPSECILVVEVTKGVNTVTDEIVVRTNVTADGYYADFMAGLDIQIGNVKINKKMFGEDVTIKHVTSDETIGSDVMEGIYFVEENATLTYSKSGKTTEDGISSLVVIGNNINVKSAFALSSSLLSLRGDGGLGLLLKNISFDVSDKTAYVLNVDPAKGENEFKFDYIVFDGCIIKYPKANSFCYINNGTNPKIPVSNIAFYNSTVSIPSAPVSNGQAYLFNMGGSTFTGWKTFCLRNNVFYCNEDNKLTANFSLMQANTASNVFESMILDSNSFINLSSTNGYIRASVQSISCGNNLIWSNQSLSGRAFAFVKGTNTEWDTTTSMNQIYQPAGALFAWIHTSYYQPENVSANTEITTSDPFEGGTFNLTGGVFKTSTGIGANIE